MRVIRTQWPVGQGCFATGIIDADGAVPRHYVYDCGARNVTELMPIVSAYADRVKVIEALFISHLDGDHVDGLDYLLATNTVTTVYLPYLDMAQRVAVLMEAEAAGALSSSLIQAQLDPVIWFGSRGVGSVILVRNNGDLPEGGYIPSGGGGDRPPERGEETTSLKIVGLSEPKVTDPSANAQTGTQLLEMIVGGAVLAMSGGATKWVLVPYVPYVDPVNVAAFENGVRIALGLNASEPITADIVQKKLRDKDGRSALRDCYDDIIVNGAGTNHNKVSMSLYSGPDGPSSQWRHRSSHRHWYDDEVWYHYSGNEGRVGWIGTGDAKLRSKYRRLEWERFYRSLAPFIGTVLLPHHGSRENWHPDILTITGATLFVAAADEQDKGYRHPSKSVVFDIEDAGGTLAHVTRQPRSRLKELIVEI